MTNAEKLRGYRADAIARGKCGECRKRDAEPDRMTCTVCLDRHRDRSNRYRDRGLCKCGRPIASRHYCQLCLESRRRRTAVRRAEAIALRMCPNCFTKPCEPDRAACAACLASTAARVRRVYARRRAA